MRRILIVLLLLPGLCLAYSLFALGRPGEPLPPVDARGRALGNTALGLWDNYNLSLLNPANLAGYGYSTFTMTTLREFNAYRVSAGESNYTTTGIPNLQYIFALSDSFNAALGWRERQSWRFEYATPLTDGGEQVGWTTVEGSGSVNAASLALGWHAAENLGLGLRVSGLIGDPEETWTADYDDEDYGDYGSTTDVLRSEIRGLAVAAGVNLRFGDLNTAAYCEIPVLGDVTRVTESSFGEIEATDTEFNYPINFGAGLGWTPDDHWSLVADFRYELWSGFRVGEVEPGYEDAFHVGLGAEFVPVRRINAPFLARLPLRLGGFYEQLYDAPSGQALTEYGATVGLGMFMGEEDESALDVSFQYSRRGDLEANGLEEEFYRVIFTLNGADTW